MEIKKIFSSKQKIDKKCLEIAKIISSGDADLMSELKEDFADPQKYIEKHYDRLSEDYFLDDDEMEEFVADNKWGLMTDLLELYGYVCQRDWKDELEDFLYFLFQTKRAVSENIKIDESDLAKEGDIPQWCALIDDKLAEENFVVGHIDTDSDQYTMFLCTVEELDSLKKSALAIDHKIDFAKNS